MFGFTLVICHSPEMFRSWVSVIALLCGLLISTFPSSDAGYLGGRAFITGKPSYKSGRKLLIKLFLNPLRSKLKEKETFRVKNFQGYSTILILACYRIDGINTCPIGYTPCLDGHCYYIPDHVITVHKNTKA